MTGRIDHAAVMGAAIAGVGCLAAVADWATRPPCPDNYVRLVDVVPIAAALCGLLAVVLGWRAARTMPWTRRRKEVRGVTVAASVLLAVGAALPTLLAFVSLLQHRGQSLDSSCWTF